MGHGSQKRTKRLKKVPQTIALEYYARTEVVKLWHSRKCIKEVAKRLMTMI